MLKTAHRNIQIEADALARFKASWPCHGIAEAAARIEFWFDASGDLVDINACDATGDWVDLDHDRAGEALIALCADAKSRLARPTRKAGRVH